jgi:hypothetical protein
MRMGIARNKLTGEWPVPELRTHFGGGYTEDPDDGYLRQ